MIIKILQDNSVFAKYQDERGSEVINSTHAEKAQDPLVKALANALPFKGAMVFDQSAPDVVLNPFEGSFVVGGRAITPDDDATAETAEVKAALDAFYGPNRDSDYAEIYRLLNLQDEPDTVVTQKVSKPVIKNVNGQLRRVMEPVDEPVMEEVPVYDESGVEVIDTIKQQKIRKGKKVSDEQKQRLAELLERARNV